MPDDPLVFMFGEFKTLPIYVAMARTLEPIHRFSKGQVSIEYKVPEYKLPAYRLDSSTLRVINTDPAAAISAINEWQSHFSNYLYFVQFKDDPSRHLVSALHDHTELVSVLCDARLHIDPSELWKAFDGLFGFECVHSEYRADEQRDSKWDDYASRLDRVYTELSEHLRSATRLILRIVKQVQLKSTTWNQLPPLAFHKSVTAPPSELLLFYSYSHKDEQLRDQLENHLALLKRQGIIAGWHDRRISAGREWEGQIDTNLNAAHVILLLVSADFIASDYCYDVETNRALDRHNAGEARLIPIILRACDWTSAPFGKIQALPKDAKPITSWSNIDEAFTDAAKGIRKAIHEMRIVESK